MTGFQEQKLKCILWELATDDYEFRYKLLSNSKSTSKSYGECSRYDDKKNILNDLWEQIHKFKPSIDLNVIDKAALWNTLHTDMEDIFAHSNILEWSQSDFEGYREFFLGITDKQFITRQKKQIALLTNSDNLTTAEKTNNLYDAYDKLYSHRNRCAHNTLSQQPHLPTLQMLSSPSYKYENYFIRFYVIALIDRIFVRFWREYIAAVESSGWH
ncbi:hypothetical protein I180019D1_21010 [Alistipes sp. i18-0019-D1]